VIYEDALWRIEHILEPIPMAGWLIAKPLRHVTTFADLTAEEAAAFGPLMHRTMGALQRVLGAEKVYLCLFSEAEGFVHIHVHLIPAMRDWTAAQRGPAVFELIGEAKRRGNLVEVAGAAVIAERIGAELRRGTVAP
jgi:diadenosine tetraphosphate (Ap4A) HIT family hydrolase